MKTNSIKRHSRRTNRHSNQNSRVRKSYASAAQAPPTFRAAARGEEEQERRRQNIRELEEVAASGSNSGVNNNFGGQPRINMNRRNSFEDFATLDTVIASMLQRCQQMAQILQNAGSGSPCTSQSSIEQSIYLSETFEQIQPLMQQLEQEVQQGSQLFSSPIVPSLQLLSETAQKLEESGESCLIRRLENVRGQQIATWQEMNSKMKIFSMQDRQVMSYLRHLKSQSPSGLPIFPRNLDTSNTFILMGDSGVFFFAQDFLCRGLVPNRQDLRNPSRDQQVEKNEEMFWYEASDTDDEVE
ncbi:unnamed protein product [Caenorhabditis angaria]|uniref:Uncharacterized protein n=1 Tax=Caenorhabditis angaria TaxID=860376 RepID=A0A9P1MYU1_9PELO|nr:unnamed protein product [Caenorhabditis angaria]